MEYNKLLNKANEELKKVVDYIKQNESMFDYMDLKLHNVSYYCYTEMKNDFPLVCKEYDDIFERFCDIEYDWFIEWCREEGIDFNKMHYQLGRTSKFYLHNWYDKNIDFMLYNIIEDGCWYALNYFNLTNGVITSTDIEDYEDTTIESLEYIANDFYNDFMNAIEDIKKVYDYIVSFKENQVENFKSFCKYYEEELEYQAEEEEMRINRAKQTCIDIKNKYVITNEDMETLKKNIMYF